MKIQCEFCNKDEASVFCSADEAALCHGCDHCVHHANKLAGKHHRFSLLLPSPKHFPLCDICQEKRAFLFCQEDRAVLCKDCDVPIHKANEHTQKHNRFLLTGVKLSPTSSLYSSSSSSSVMDGCDVVHHFPTQKSSNKPTSLPPPVIPNNPPSLPKVPTTTTTATIVDKFGKNNQVMNGVGNGSTSSISEYLIEMLPGWHVEDFLDSSSTPSTFLKTGDSDLMSFWDAELEGTLSLSSFSSEKMGFLVPQAPSSLLSTSFSQSNMCFGGTVDFKDTMEAQAANKIKTSRKWRDNGCFNVPHISPPSKRSRTSWY